MLSRMTQSLPVFDRDLLLVFYVHEGSANRRAHPKQADATIELLRTAMTLAVGWIASLSDK
jgi:hypothetical protein